MIRIEEKTEKILKELAIPKPEYKLKQNFIEIIFR